MTLTRRTCGLPRRDRPTSARRGTVAVPPGTRRMNPGRRAKTHTPREARSGRDRAFPRSGVQVPSGSGAPAHDPRPRPAQVRLLPSRSDPPEETPADRKSSGGTLPRSRHSAGRQASGGRVGKLDRVHRRRRIHRERPGPALGTSIRSLVGQPIADVKSEAGLPVPSPRFTAKAVIWSAAILGRLGESFRRAPSGTRP